MSRSVILSGDCSMSVQLIGSLHRSMSDQVILSADYSLSDPVIDCADCSMSDQMILSGDSFGAVLGVSGETKSLACDSRSRQLAVSSLFESGLQLSVSTSFSPVVAQYAKVGISLIILVLVGSLLLLLLLTCCLIFALFAKMRPLAELPSDSPAWNDEPSVIIFSGDAEFDWEDEFAGHVWFENPNDSSDPFLSHSEETLWDLPVFD
jgi:hypothetical protein